MIQPSRFVCITLASLLVGTATTSSAMAQEMKTFTPQPEYGISPRDAYKAAQAECGMQNVVRKENYFTVSHRGVPGPDGVVHNFTYYITLTGVVQRDGKDDRFFDPRVTDPYVCANLAFERGWRNADDPNAPPPIAVTGNDMSTAYAPGSFVNGASAAALTQMTRVCKGLNPPSAVVWVLPQYSKDNFQNTGRRWTFFLNPDHWKVGDAAFHPWIDAPAWGWSQENHFDCVGKLERPTNVQDFDEQMREDLAKAPKLSVTRLTAGDGIVLMDDAKHAWVLPRSATPSSVTVLGNIVSLSFAGNGNSLTLILSKAAAQRLMGDSMGTLTSRGRLMGDSMGTIVASGAGNIVASGAGNVVGDAPRLIGPGGSLVGDDGSSFRRGGSLIGENGSALKLVGDDGSSLTKIIASVIGHDGGSLISNVIGHDGGSVIGHDGGSVIGHDGGSVIGHDGGSVIGHDGGSVIAFDRANKIMPSGTASSNGFQSTGGGGGFRQDSRIEAFSNDSYDRATRYATVKDALDKCGDLQRLDLAHVETVAILQSSGDNVREYAKIPFLDEPAMAALAATGAVAAYGCKQQLEVNHYRLHVGPVRAPIVSARDDASGESGGDDPRGGPRRPGARPPSPRPTVSPVPAGSPVSTNGGGPKIVAITAPTKPAADAAPQTGITTVHRFTDSGFYIVAGHDAWIFSGSQVSAQFFNGLPNRFTVASAGDSALFGVAITNGNAATIRVDGRPITAAGVGTIADVNGSRIPQGRPLAVAGGAIALADLLQLIGTGAQPPPRVAPVGAPPGGAPPNPPIAKVASQDGVTTVHRYATSGRDSYFIIAGNEAWVFTPDQFAPGRKLNDSKTDFVMYQFLVANGAIPNAVFTIAQDGTVTAPTGRKISAYGHGTIDASNVPQGAPLFPTGDGKISVAFLQAVLDALPGRPKPTLPAALAPPGLPAAPKPSLGLYVGKVKSVPLALAALGTPAYFIMMKSPDQGSSFDEGITFARGDLRRIASSTGEVLGVSIGQFEFRLQQNSALPNRGLLLYNGTVISAGEGTIEPTQSADGRYQVRSTRLFVNPTFEILTLVGAHQVGGRWAWSPSAQRMAAHKARSTTFVLEKTVLASRNP